MTHRQLATLLFWLDRVPPCTARWEVEAIVLEALSDARQSPSMHPVSGFFVHSVKE